MILKKLTFEPGMYKHYLNSYLYEKLVMLVTKVFKKTFLTVILQFEKFILCFDLFQNESSHQKQMHSHNLLRIPAKLPIFLKNL